MRYFIKKATSQIARDHAEGISGTWLKTPAFGHAGSKMINSVAARQ